MWCLCSKNKPKVFIQQITNHQSKNPKGNRNPEKIKPVVITVNFGLGKLMLPEKFCKIRKTLGILKLKLKYAGYRFKSAVGNSLYH